MITTWLTVEPLDTMMVRDGRAFNAGQASRAAATPPPPSTLGGVVFWANGDKRVERIFGPVAELAGTPLFPTPADVVRDEDTGHQVRRLSPVDRLDNECSDLDDRLRFSHAVDGAGAPIREWITAAGLTEWLHAGALGPGAVLNADSRDRYLREPPWVVESRLGLAREWYGPRRNTAADQMLYLAGHLRPTDRMRFLVGCENPAPITEVRKLAKFGGRSRMAQVDIYKGEDPLPRAPDRFPDGRLTVYLATPGLFDDVLWCPPEATLCALAMTGPAPIATASPRSGIGQTRLLVWAVPAGTVYYLKFDNDAAARAWSVRHHGRLLPDSSDYDIATAGFGTCLTGSW